MANYVDAGCQTVLAGLTQRPIVRPDILFTAPDTTTPPDDLITEKPQVLDYPSPTSRKPHQKPSLLERRAMHGPRLVDRIPLPKPRFDSDALPSPPPTQALLSPLPAANRLYAGHTPRMPRALSPGEVEDENLAQLHVIEKSQKAAQTDESFTPDEDIGLKGPLSLPALPTNLDGSDEHIALDALDEELSRIAREQERFSKLKDAPEPTPKPNAIEEELPLSRQTSASHPYNTLDTDIPDGVFLKSPRMNFGAPIGHIPARRRSEPTQASP